MNDTPESVDSAEVTLADHERFNRLILASATYKRDTLRLFRPLPHQEPVFTSRASELLVRGGNRSSKTICCSMEVGSAATGIPICDHNGQQFSFKYPTDRPLMIWLIGYGESHIGDTFYRMLFRRNPEMRMIRDLETGAWRAHRPWEQSDKDRVKESRMAPPLIPPRMISDWAWKDKAKRHFTICRLKPRAEFGQVDCGTEIHAFTSKGEPKMGDPVDLIWIDEKIMFSKHYAEWQARISDRGGRILWSLWPGNANAAIYDLISRAKLEAKNNSDNPDVEEVVLRFSDNPFIPAEEKAKRLKGWSEDERRSRDEGELVRGTSQIYPNFSADIHGAPALSPGMDDVVDKVLRENGGVPPLNWRRDLILDPGHAHPGVLFCAIPPDSLGDCAVVYDELYLPQSDATELAKAVSLKMQGMSFESFIIDSRAGRQTPMGFSKTVIQQYSDAFAVHSLQCRVTRSSFVWGSDDLLGGISLVRGRLHITKTGRPWLRVVTEACPNFMQQMETYIKGQDAQGYTTDKPAKGQIDCLPDCLRYYIANDPKYLPPAEVVRQPSAHYRYFKDEWNRSEKPADESVYLGPGSAKNQALSTTNL